MLMLIFLVLREKYYLFNTVLLQLMDIIVPVKSEAFPYFESVCFRIVLSFWNLLTAYSIPEADNPGYLEDSLHYPGWDGQ